MPRILKCTVPHCGNKDTNFASVPNDERRAKFFELLCLDPNVKVHRLCHAHFLRSDFGISNTKLQRHALPKKNLPVRQFVN